MSFSKNFNKKWISLMLIIAIVVTTYLPAALLPKAAAAKDSVAEWTFTSNDNLKATEGNDANKGISLLSISNNRTLSYTASNKTLYTNGWDKPDGYWQVKIDTTDFTDLDLTYKAFGTSTSPKEFQIQYSLTGNDDDFHPIANVELTAAIASYGPFALPEAVENQSSVYIRWLNTSNTSISGPPATVQSGGNSRIADIQIQGISQAAPAVAKVEASPTSNAWPAGTEIKLNSATTGASIYYAFDSEQNPFSLYSEPVILTNEFSIYTYASFDGLSNSVGSIFDYTLLEKTDISAARLSAKNQNVWTEGIVSHIDGAKTYIQDETGGIVLYGMNIPDASLGDKVSVQGVMEIYSGLQELKPQNGLTSKVLEKNAGVPEAKLVTANDLTPSNGEQYEAQLVYLENVTIDRKSGTVFKAKQDGIAAEFDIYSSLSSLQEGKKFEKIIGVIEEYNGNFQLIPLNSSSLIENKFSVQASPDAGTIAIGNGVTLSTPDNEAVIYYTTDGSTPTENSLKYTAPIVVNEDTTIKAIVVKDNVLSIAYVFEYKAVKADPRIHDIQGTTHTSPYLNQNVQDVEGVVTQLSYQFATGAYRGFYIQDIEPDNDDRTSEAVYVYSTNEEIKPKVGDLVSISGKVEEYNEGLATNLTTTQLTNIQINVLSSDNDLPKPILLGKGGRALPTSIIDSDGMTTFNPDVDAIAFYESLEGMHVKLSKPTIISPYWTSGAGNSMLYNIPTRVENEEEDVLTPAGGLILKEALNYNPQRLIIAYGDPVKEVGTGDVFTDDVIGVVGYNNGNFKIIPSKGSLPEIHNSTFEREITELEIDPNKLTMASYNVENFHPGTPQEKINKIGDSIVINLKSPDIIALLEIQDNNGPVDNGVVAADKTYETIINAVIAAGGPAYKYTDISPQDKKDGGEPGGNIRVGFLYNPDRVKMTDSVLGQAGTATTAVSYNAENDNLTVNPGRIDPTNTAFNASRKPLVAQFEFNGEKVIAIVNHFNSKGGDNGPFGNIQPPVLSSEVQRHKIANVVNGFVKDVVTKNSDANVVVMGDLNDFQFTETLNILKGNEMINLIDTLPINDRYSYTYDGNSQTLDHILVSNNLASASKVDVVHINADFPLSRGRASDHDPLMAQIDLKGQAEPSEDDFQLRVLHTNDTHARLDSVAKRVTAINENKNDHSILLDAGDVFSGTLYFTKYEGLADLEFMNMVGYDAMVPGNHEFDKGPEGLERFIKEAQFPILSANIDYSGNEGLSKLFKNEIGGLNNPIEHAHIYPSIVIDVNGEQVGVFGLTTEETVGISSPGNTLVFQDYIARAKATVASLQEQGINKIVALTHLGYSFDEILADEVEGIDIIVGGHSHTLLPKPVVKHVNGEPTIIVQTGEYGEKLGVIDATFDDKGVLTTWDGNLLHVADYAEDTVAKEKLQGYKTSLDEMMAEVVGHSLVELDYNAMIDGKLQRAVRRQETNLGNLITDGMAAAMKEKITSLLPSSELAEIKGYIALQNGGGIREGISSGDITLGEVRTVLPFDNSIVAVKVTGTELIAALENGVSGSPAEYGGFAHVSGMKYTYDSTKAKQTLDTQTEKITFNGNRIVEVQIKNEDGTYSKLDPNAYYMLATNSFTASGGDFYYALRDARQGGRIYELFMPDYEVFLAHLDRVGTIDIGLEGRITDLKGQPLPGTGGNGGNSGGNNPTPETNPGESNQGDIVTVKVSSENISKETNAQGKIVTTVSVQVDALKEAIKQAEVAGKATKKIQVDIANVTDGKITIQLPAAALIDAKKDTIISVNAGNYSYDLPLNILAMEKLAEELGTKMAELIISINIEVMAQDNTDKLTLKVEEANGKLLHAPIEFTIMAQANGKSQEVNGFGNIFVERSITIGSLVNPSTATVVSYDPLTDQLTFVPAIFETVNGKTNVTVKRNSNSQYAVVSFNKSFEDMTKHWAKADVELLASKFIVQGKSETNFTPDQSITRAEFAALLVRSLGLKEDSSALAFNDVDTNSWYAGVVGAAVKAKLIEGFEDGSFRPEAQITREQVAVMIARALAMTGKLEEAGQLDATAKFEDGASIQAWAKDAVGISASAGIVQGNANQMFAPAKNATRAEATAILKRLLSFVEFINS